MQKQLEEVVRLVEEKGPLSKRAVGRVGGGVAKGWKELQEARGDTEEVGNKEKKTIRNKAGRMLRACHLAMASKRELGG